MFIDSSKKTAMAGGVVSMGYEWLDIMRSGDHNRQPFPKRIKHGKGL
ncbi:MAG: hypothetical protein JO126_09320 [Alphaproteobacteria bacterium]|nr:hypothetical protein [Alphaproteobacteria bacterium]MBV8549642.1 hypothetical protein [Alphaproteobacteria bacterium]